MWPEYSLKKQYNFGNVADNLTRHVNTLDVFHILVSIVLSKLSTLPYHTVEVLIRELGLLKLFIYTEFNFVEFSTYTNDE